MLNHALRRKFVVLCFLVALDGCASIIDGSSQPIQVNTTPDGAHCSFVSNDKSIASVSSTPNSVVVEKTKYDITIKCDKAGYDEVTYSNKSDIDGWVFGNILFGGLIGWGIDSALGADNKYESPVNITLPQK